MTSAATWVPAVAAGLILFGTTSAEADPKFEYGKSDEVAKVKGVEWNATAEAGVVFTTGNSETTTATGGLKAARKTGNNKVAADASITYARAGLRVLADRNGNGMIDDETEITTARQVTAEALAGKLRYDRFLTTSNSLFIAALASRDIPAGKKLVLGGQVGYSRQIHKTKSAEAVAEIGYDYSNENLVAGPEISIHSARAYVGLKAELTEGTTFDTSGELLTNLNKETLPTRTEEVTIGQDTRFNLRTAISAKIGSSFAFQTSLEARFDNRPAPLGVKGLTMGFVPEASRLDTVMKASLIYTIF